LDRLGPIAKEVAQIGSVIGREFGYDLVELVARRPAPELRRGLDRLTDAGLLFCRGTPPRSSYLFKHPLVQDAAYGTLLRARRQELHARVAAALEQHFADLLERQPELLAHHLTEAGNLEQRCHPFRLPTRASPRKRGKPRQVDGALASPLVGSRLARQQVICAIVNARLRPR